MFTEDKEIFYEKYKGGYRLLQDAHYIVAIRPEISIVNDMCSLTTTGELTIFKHTWWDGASGPAIDTKNTMRASLPHDVLIILVRRELLPNTSAIKLRVDMEYFRIVREDGMSLFRAIYQLFAIQWNRWERKLKSALRRMGIITGKGAMT